MYRGEREDRNRSSRSVAISLVISFVVVAVAWFVFRSGYFDAAQIGIEGLRSLEKGDVEREVGEALAEQSRWRPWHPTNVLMVDVPRLESRLKERLFAESVTVDKSYPNILRLKIEERQRSVVLVTGEQFLLVDTNGIVTGFAEGSSLSTATDHLAARSFLTADSLPVIQMPTDEPPAPGFQIASPEAVQAWIQISRILISRGLDTYFIKIEDPESHLGRFVMRDKYELRIDLSSDIVRQLDAYETYLRTAKNPSIKEYIDVRVPGKIFVK